MMTDRERIAKLEGMVGSLMGMVKPVLADRGFEGCKEKRRWAIMRCKCAKDVKIYEEEFTESDGARKVVAAEAASL